MSDVVLSPNEVLLWTAGVVILMLASFLFGRRTGGTAARVGELEEELEASLRERERLAAETEGYKTRVADHFAETSHRLHDLTLQYRAVYDHLAKGAQELCPEGFEKLEGGLGLDALPEESGPRRDEAHDDDRDEDRL